MLRQKCIFIKDLKHMIKRMVVILLIVQVTARAQDTFSILAYDSITGEIGGAGASCVDLYLYPFLTNHFIIELFPDTGAIATQAAYTQLNQNITRQRMRAGDRPSELLAYMYNNDNNPEVRQYGVLRKVNDTILAAAFTGTNCTDFKNHITGPNYTIHGNILLGQHILDSMEAGFLRSEGSLACKLMAAMRGARVVGADTRCASNNSSSLFAFLKVTLPTDTFDKPSFLISLKTHNGDSIEPIDSLQKLFDAAAITCTVENTSGLHNLSQNDDFRIYPNPAGNRLIVTGRQTGEAECRITDLSGRIVHISRFSGYNHINVGGMDRGLYLIEIRTGVQTVTRKVILY
jgi:uncharacterized Ntn-hydrolase superfamily protein